MTAGLLLLGLVLAGSLALVFNDGDSGAAAPVDDPDETDPEAMPEVPPATDDLLEAIANERLDGFGGNDTLIAAETSDGAVLDGGADDDTLDLSGRNATGLGGSGNDFIEMTTTLDPDDDGEWLIDGGDGDDTLEAAGLTGTVLGGPGNDLISVYGVDTAEGGEGNDTIYSGQVDFGGGTPVDGGDGDDLIVVSEAAGFSEQNVASGGAGDDILRTDATTPTTGFDIFSGGEGADRFEAVPQPSGADGANPVALGNLMRITDFDPAEDIIVINPSFIASIPQETGSEGFDTELELIEAPDGRYTDIRFVISTGTAEASATGIVRLDGITGLRPQDIDFRVMGF